MIKYANDKISAFIGWLNENYGIKEPVYITVMHGYDSIQSDNGEGFAAYYPAEPPVMFVAGEAPESVIKEGVDGDEFLYEIIAHEYAHHIQNSKGELPVSESKKSEEYAERFAKRVVKEYLKQI
jgi:hypothetical protein